jgi:F-type H+-transporting ATPase subunit b
MLPVVGLLACAAPALASGEGAEHGGIGDLLYPAINFLILVGVLVYFARKPIQAFFAERRGTIQSDLESAAALQRQAEARHSKWQRRLVDLERELQEIRATSRERAERERDRILADAKAAAERIRDDAHNAIGQELRRAKDLLREEASELAVELASGMLRDNLTEGDRDRLLDEFIERIERPGDAPGNGR